MTETIYALYPVFVANDEFAADLGDVDDLRDAA